MGCIGLNLALFFSGSCWCTWSSRLHAAEFPPRRANSDDWDFVKVPKEAVLFPSVSSDLRSRLG